ncbi:MAG: hypothetical protein OXD47_05290 [Gammaproteobacteria bacterium]|nr:hypothetical protein [Gammaproteobacteria bacterium]MCY4338199.1 hypothetical protein [Gammaproteobacteria bacterium]
MFIRLTLGLAASLVLAGQVAAQAYFAGEDIEVTEGGTAVFIITMPIHQDFDVRYSYRTQDGSAKAGEDYQAKQGTVEILKNGPQTKRVEIQTYSDGDVWDAEFELVLFDRYIRSKWRDHTYTYKPVPAPADVRIRATIKDAQGGDSSYEDEKYGSGYTGSVFGE